MILVLSKEADLLAVSALRERLENMGFNTALSYESGNHAVAVLSGLDGTVKQELFQELPFVETVLPLSSKYKLVGTEIKKTKTVIEIKGKKIGDGGFVVIAGPCSIESEQQVNAIATAVSQSGATILRGGAFKPRTSPYDFQGLGEEGLKYLRDAAHANDMLCITEVMDPAQMLLVAEYADILQIGARNMQNFALLKLAGQVNKPVLLKRGLSATYNEFLLAAEYILSHGNPNVILCERGIRTFETYARNTLDIAAVPILRELTHLPIIVDPSHGTGLRSIVPPMAYAAMAVKADGVMVEVHTDPDRSISDAQQTMAPVAFAEMMTTLAKLGEAVNMSVQRGVNDGE